MLRDLSPAMRITRGIRECHVALALFLLLAGGVRARAEGLPELLQAVATNARFASPARADVRIECGESCNATGTPAIFLGRGEVLYVEVRGGQRVLIRPGEILVAQGGKASAAVPGQTLADTDVLLEDLAVFTPGALKQPQISDDGPAEVVVTAAPAGRSSYALLVNTIDRERHAIIRTLYYRDLINNLTRNALTVWGAIIILLGLAPWAFRFIFNPIPLAAVMSSAIVLPSKAATSISKPTPA